MTEEAALGQVTGVGMAGLAGDGVRANEVGRQSSARRACQREFPDMPPRPLADGSIWFRRDSASVTRLLSLPLARSDSMTIARRFNAGFGVET